MKKGTKIAIGTGVALAGAGVAYLYGTKKGKVTRKKIASMADKKVAQMKKVAAQGNKMVAKGKKIVAQAKKAGVQAKKTVTMMAPAKKAVVNKAKKKTASK